MLQSKQNHLIKSSELLHHQFPIFLLSYLFPNRGIPGQTFRIIIKRRMKIKFVWMTMIHCWWWVNIWTFTMYFDQCYFTFDKKKQLIFKKNNYERFNCFSQIFNNWTLSTHENFNDIQRYFNDEMMKSFHWQYRMCWNYLLMLYFSQCCN